MKKVLPFLISAALLSGAVFPVAASAAVGAFCASNSDCNTAAGEYCYVQGSVCASGGSGGGGGAGGLNTTLLEGWAGSIVGFINLVLVPLLTALAFIVFLWGVYKYFIYGADNEDSRKEGKMFVLYGIIGFVIIFSLWGLVNVGVTLLNVGTGPRSDSTLPFPKL